MDLGKRGEVSRPSGSEAAQTITSMLPFPRAGSTLAPLAPTHESAAETLDRGNQSTPSIVDGEGAAPRVQVAPTGQTQWIQAGEKGDAKDRNRV